MKKINEKQKSIRKNIPSNTKMKLRNIKKNGTKPIKKKLKKI